MVILFFPLCFQPFDGKIVEKLKGYHAPPDKVPLGIQTWFDGSWQQYTEAISKDKLQARHFLIRINNQLKYSLFEALNANDVIRGKNDYYFEGRFIRSHLGMDYKGEEFIAKKVEKLQELNDTLKNHGIEMLFVFASGKGNFMPENIPENYQNVEKGQSNYKTYLDFFKKTDISYLDLNQYLLNMKDTTSYPLYTKGNIHWSFYAISYVTDTLIQTIENQLNKNLISYSRSPVEIKYEPTYYTEGGIFKSLNLYWTQLKDTFAYRHVIFNRDGYKDTYKPKIWAVGDSFYGTLMTYKIPHQFFDPGSLFFYYNNNVVNIQDSKYRYGKIEQHFGKLDELDMLILFSTDAGVQGCCWGAVDDILKHYKQNEER